VTPGKGKAKLLIAERALRDLAEIEAYSAAEWGKRTAARYIEDIEAALVRIEEKPDLLRPEEGFHTALSFYRVNKHLLICDRQPKAIFLLTVIHASRDIPSRLAELAPTLAAETELLHRQLKEGKRR
jgi:plasmid stabilization system protein ParE